jgi:transcription elongation factor GreA
LLLRKLEKQSIAIKDMKLLKVKPEEIANGISHYTRVFEELPDNETKKELIELLRKNNKDWEQIIAEFLKTKPTRAHNYIMDELFGHGVIEELKLIIKHIVNNYRNNPELFVWTCKYLYSELEIFKATVEDEGGLIYNLIQLIDSLGRDIENKKDVTLNRKTLNQNMELLFKDNVLSGYLNRSENESIKKCILMVKGSVYLDEKTKFSFLEPYKTKFPEIFVTKEQEEQLHHFLVTKRAYEEKKKQLEHILNVEIPKNSKDIGEAQEKGDLRENAEYQSALEKQKNLQVSSNKLDDDIKKAKVIHAKNVDVTKTSVGTKVTLKNLDNDKEEIFKILGEWDSDPEKNIVSYKSPFGASILGYKVNQEIEVKLAENKKLYKVLAIELADDVADD